MKMTTIAMLALAAAMLALTVTMLEGCGGDGAEEDWAMACADCVEEVPTCYAAFGYTGPCHSGRCGPGFGYDPIMCYDPAGC